MEVGVGHKGKFTQVMLPWIRLPSQSVSATIPPYPEVSKSLIRGMGPQPMRHRTASETSNVSSRRPAKAPEAGLSPAPPKTPTNHRHRIAETFSAIKEWVDRQYDLLLPRVSIISNFIAPAASIGLWILQITFGVYLGLFLTDYQATSTIFDWDLMRRNWLLIPIGFAMTILYIVRRSAHHRARRTKQLQDALEWFSEDMGFHENPEHDVRCTIWAPAGRPNPRSTIRMRQLVYYEPRMSAVANGDSPRYKRNGLPGRIMRVSRNKGGFELPIGILGKTAFDSIYNKKAETNVENIPDGVNFQERMIDNWNFSALEAKELSQDRRSYLTISLTDQNRSTLLAVVYCDSRDPTALTEKIGNAANKHLPYLARIITSP